MKRPIHVVLLVVLFSVLSFLGGFLGWSSSAEHVLKAHEPASSEQAPVEISGTLYSVHSLPHYFVLTIETKTDSPPRKVLVIATSLPHEDQERSFQALLDKDIVVKGFSRTTTRPQMKGDLSELYEALRYCLFMQARLGYFERPEHIQHLIALSISVRSH